VGQKEPLGHNFLAMVPLVHDLALFLYALLQKKAGVLRMLAETVYLISLYCETFWIYK
jgi:hypothetical protein